ncbi:hypothetical protein XENOCAPTIV_007933 [Xenoophorus captivus]|uniref:Uncharacterized protein n=1 Tax=Xenoophorus captivus TaxID=1517983 RepID=A0ABV0RKB7_9TELE
MLRAIQTNTHTHTHTHNHTFSIFSLYPFNLSVSHMQSERGEWHGLEISLLSDHNQGQRHSRRLCRLFFISPIKSPLLCSLSVLFLSLSVIFEPLQTYTGYREAQYIIPFCLKVMIFWVFLFVTLQEIKQQLGQDFYIIRVWDIKEVLIPYSLF